MINEVDLSGELENETLENIGMIHNLLDHQSIYQNQFLLEKTDVKSLKEISKTIEQKILDKQESPCWKIIQSEHCSIEVGVVENYSFNLITLSGLDALQYIMQHRFTYSN